MTLQRMDNVLIVVDDLAAAKAFFGEGVLCRAWDGAGFPVVTNGVSL